MEVRSLVKAGEPGIAVENLCTHLLEEDAVVPGHIVDELKLVGVAMGIREVHWKRIDRRPGD
ncbi:MAG: hypothetical protein K8H88_27460 [Sandaracinaceae bacterium]|nr:hypothetical protein [Sandaracinaceae bacterium]